MPQVTANPPKNQAYIWAIVVLFVAAVGFVLSTFVLKTGSDGSAYSAIHLTNNQVYFGRIASESSGYLKLEEVYYLKDHLAPTDPAVASGEVSLIKLGKELHGPTDQLKISRAQIILVETLKEDSKVVAAIKQHQSGR